MCVGLKDFMEYGCGYNRYFANLENVHPCLAVTRPFQYVKTKIEKSEISLHQFQTVVYFEARAILGCKT